MWGGGGGADGKPVTDEPPNADGHGHDVNRWHPRNTGNAAHKPPSDGPCTDSEVQLPPTKVCYDRGKPSIHIAGVDAGHLAGGGGGPGGEGFDPRSVTESIQNVPLEISTTALL